MILLTKLHLSKPHQYCIEKSFVGKGLTSMTINWKSYLLMESPHMFPKTFVNKKCRLMIKIFFLASYILVFEMLQYVTRQTV
jgi:hypothetical protein